MITVIKMNNVEMCIRFTHLLEVNSELVTERRYGTPSSCLVSDNPDYVRNKQISWFPRETASIQLKKTT